MSEALTEAPNIGDIVVLISGGPRMVVERLLTNAPDVVSVVWFSQTFSRTDDVSNSQVMSSSGPYRDDFNFRLLRMAVDRPRGVDDRSRGLKSNLRPGR